MKGVSRGMSRDGLPRGMSRDGLLPRGMSRDGLRFENLHLSESLLPNAGRLTQKRIRKEPTPAYELSPTTATAIRNKPQLKQRWCE